MVAVCRVPVLTGLYGLARKSWRNMLRNNRNIRTNCPRYAYAVRDLHCVSMGRDRYRPNQTLIGRRLALGKSQEEYAELVGATARQVRNWESGRVRCPQTWHLTRMSRLHGTTTPQQLGFAPRPRHTRPTTGEHCDRSETDMLRRDFLGLTIAAAFNTQPLAASDRSTPTTRKVGSADVDRIEQTNDTLTQADFLIGGAAFRSEALTDQFRQATLLLDGRFRHEDTRQAMHSAVGHLGSTIGFMLFDQDRHTEVRRLYTSSLRIAQDAPDRWPLRAIVFSEMARQCIQLGQYREADELLRMARGAETEVSPTFHAMLHAVHAHARAGLGDLDQTRQYVTMAEDTFATADPANDPSWISWFDQAELAGETGAALTTLAITHDAVRDEAALRLTQSANAHSATGQRSKALALVRLATVHAVRRDVTSTTTAAYDAREASRALRSPRLALEVTALRQHLQPMRRHGGIAEVDDELALLTS